MASAAHAVRSGLLAQRGVTSVDPPARGEGAVASCSRADEDVTATLKKLHRQIAKGSTPEVKRERELYSALLGLVDFVEELDAGLVLAGAVDVGSRLTRLEERLQKRE